MNPEGRNFRRFMGARVGAHDIAPRTLRQAFGNEGAFAIECFTPSPERRIVRPALIGAAALVVVLIACGVIR